MRFFHIIFFSVFIFSLVNAQKHEHDSLVIDTLVAHYSTLSPDFHLSNDTSEFSIDLNSFKGFNPLNNLTWSATNGYLGSPYQILWLPEYVDQLHPDFFAFFHRPDEYLFFRENIPLFFDSIPFSVVSYSSGHKREQYFDFLHAQPLSKSWKLSLDYRLINSLGAYKNQKNNLSNFYAITSYSSRSKNYHLHAGFILNKIFQQENGGIANENEFIDTNLYDRALTRVNLYSAENRFRQNDYFVVNEINFGRKAKTQHYLQHTFNLRRERHIYSDSYLPDSSFYNVWNSPLSNDSVNHYAFENKLVFGNRLAKNIRWNLGLLITDDHLYIANKDSVLSQKILLGSFLWDMHNGFSLLATGSTDIFPVSGGDHDIHLELISDDSLNWKPYLRFSYCLISPQIYYYRYSGNHFSWEKDWLQTKTLLGILGLEHGAFQFTGYYAILTNHMYFVESRFNQGGTGTVFGANLSVDAELNRFQFKANVGLQEVTHANYVNLPPWFAKAEISMKTGIFKKALSLQTGLSAWINGSFYADAYNPALQVFFMQRNIKTGGFVYPTAFVRAQIKRAIVFAELMNFTAGLTKVNYWQIPGYPLLDRSFRFGVTWTFLN